MSRRSLGFAALACSVLAGAQAQAPGPDELAVWHGNYYAVETMRHLGLEDGAVRAGIVHYNTEGEVDRLLEALAELT